MSSFLLLWMRQRQKDIGPSVLRTDRLWRQVAAAAASLGFQAPTNKEDRF
jgi:hypothetical protein